MGKRTDELPLKQIAWGGWVDKWKYVKANKLWWRTWKIIFLYDGQMYAYGTRTVEWILSD